MGVLLGLDVGAARIGVARSDELGITAHPLCTLTRKNRQVDLVAISDLVSIHKVERVIIGLPISLDGTIGTQALSVQKFAERLGKVIEVPIEFWDERFTTVEAEDVLRELNKNSKKQKDIIDQIAATIILGEYLESQRKNAPVDEDES